MICDEKEAVYLCFMHACEQVQRLCDRASWKCLAMFSRKTQCCREANSSSRWMRAPGSSIGMCCTLTGRRKLSDGSNKSFDPQ